MYRNKKLNRKYIGIVVLLKKYVEKSGKFLKNVQNYHIGILLVIRSKNGTVSFKDNADFKYEIRFSR